MAGEEVPVGQGELDSFVQKLNTWGQTLDPGERALLGVLIGRASGEGSEVEGYAMAPTSFGDAAGAFLRPLVGGGGISSARPQEVTFPADWIKGS